MAKIDARTKMDGLPVKASPFLEEAPETLSDFSKYGWSPCRMESQPSAEGVLEQESALERRNLLNEARKIGILEGLLKEAGK